ncbi:NADH-quinone oxidoreductase subunit E [Rhizobium sp. SG_E_25_P2]|uniref:5' DNA nuclease n=1 Tax=Rhizobium sp. SG_E_25_P2 TaxID=2879942 RepID=UPI0024737204|nr:5' DNA nuclease [Rhizobium sp. SG_E_25_P2]MDH6268803.1 NADH-quinone oxidoreductase subunit E [Rhizobium sp. SG_E_25_P2]
MDSGGTEKTGKTGKGSSDRSPELAELSARMLAEQASMLQIMTAFGMQMAGAFMGAVANAMERKAEDSPAAEPVAQDEPDVKAPEPPQETVAAEPPKKATAPTAKRVRKPAQKRPDDLKKISGVGPRLEKVLNGMGVTTYAQIATWSDDDVLKMDETLGLDNRIVRDQWVTQAKALLEG